MTLDVCDFYTGKMMCYWIEVTHIIGDEEELIASIDFIGGDFQTWCMIPYSEWEDLPLDNDDEYKFTLYHGIPDKGAFDEHELTVIGKNEEETIVFFEIN